MMRVEEDYNDSCWYVYGSNDERLSGPWLEEQYANEHLSMILLTLKQMMTRTVSKPRGR